MDTYTCSGCGTRYKIPDGAAGKKVRCKKCGQVSQIPAPEDDGPIPIAEVPDDFYSEAAAAAERARVAPAPAAPVAPGALDGWSAEDADALVAAGRQADLRGAGRTFWGDVGTSFLFFTHPGSMVTFAIVWVLHIASQVVGYGGCVGGLAGLILAGWVYSFYLNCIVEAASGEDELPRLALTQGILEDVVIPLVKYVLTWIILLLPAVIYLIVVGGLVAQGGLGALSVLDPGAIAELGSVVVAPTGLLAAMGVFLWPIVILAVTMGGMGTVFRIDLLLMTVFRTFLPYLATVLLVMASLAAQFGVAALLGMGGVTGMMGFATGRNIALLLLGLGLCAYVQIGAMRVIGMYYRHYKQRFAWSWE